MFEDCGECGDYADLHADEGCLLCNCELTGEDF